jgi:hypothetical protein
MLLLFALFRCSTLLGFFLFARLAFLLFTLLAFLPRGAFHRQSRLALFLGLALPILLFSTLSLETLLLFSPLALALCFTLLFLRSSPPALLLLPCLFFFSLLSIRLSPRLLFVAFLFLRCFELCLFLPKRRFLGRLLGRSLRTLFLLCLFLQPAPPQSQSGTVKQARESPEKEYGPPFVLLFLVLLGFACLAVLGRFVFVLKLAKELHLTLLRDLFAVRLEHSLLEHSRGKDGEHAFALLHLLILRKRLHTLASSDSNEESIT